MLFKQKYLKYKNKYLSLKNLSQYGGSFSVMDYVIIDRSRVGMISGIRPTQSDYQIMYKNESGTKTYESKLTLDRMMIAPLSIKKLPNPLLYKILQSGSQATMDRDQNLFATSGGRQGSGILVEIIKLRNEENNLEEYYEVKPIMTASIALGGKQASNLPFIIRSRLTPI